jgi:hypothetical protein
MNIRTAAEAHVSVLRQWHWMGCWAKLLELFIFKLLKQVRHEWHTGFIAGGYSPAGLRLKEEKRGEDWGTYNALYECRFVPKSG